MEQAKIYEITCRDPAVTESYVGITKNIRRRRCEHKSHCHNQNGVKYNTHVYQVIRLNGGWGNWRLDTVSDVEYPRGRADLKKALEARYIRELGATLNCQMPGRTPEQYYQDHKEERHVQMKQYRQDNAEKIKARGKQRYQDHKQEAKQYYQDHKEERKQYRQDNEAKLKAKHKCSCGGRYTHANRSKHVKTKIHRDYLEIKYYLDIYGELV